MIVSKGSTLATKLQPGHIYAVFYLRRKGMSYADIARKLHVSQSHVSEIISRRKWSHISRLTLEQVSQILHHPENQISVLAAQFGVHEDSVLGIFQFYKMSLFGGV